MRNNKEYYNDLVNSRQQYDCWDLSKAVPKEDIDYILEQFHRRAAVKQNRIKYKINVLDWSDPELRNDIFNFTMCEEDGLNPDGTCYKSPNAQTLAHWILVFDVDGNSLTKITNNELYEDALVEVGIAADFISHSAASIGLQTGFCRCLSKDQWKSINSINEKLDISNPSDKIALILGIGHGLEQKSMINPYTGESVRTWSRVLPERRKLPMEKYVTYYCNDEY